MECPQCSGDDEERGALVSRLIIETVQKSTGEERGREGGREGEGSSCRKVVPLLFSYSPRLRRHRKLACVTYRLPLVESRNSEGTKSPRSLRKNDGRRLILHWLPRLHRSATRWLDGNRHL